MVAPGAASPILTATDTLASAALPVRVRRILEALLAQLQQALFLGVESSLDALEQELFLSANRARSNETQTSYLSHLQHLRRDRAKVLPALLARLEAELATLRSPPQLPQAVEQPPALLTLVEDAVIDQNIVLEEIARRHSHRHQQALHLLSQRFGVLAGSPALDEARQPLSPHSLCQALRVGAAMLEVDLTSQLQLYRLFEQHVMSGYGELLEQIAQTLGRQGVLPGLVFAPQRARTPAARSASDPAPAPPASKTGLPPVELPGWVRPGQARRSTAPVVSFASLQRLLSASHARASAPPPAAKDAGLLPAWMKPGASHPAPPSPTAPPGQAAGGANATPPPVGAPHTGGFGAASEASLPTAHVISTLQTLQLQVAQGQVPSTPLALEDIRERVLAGLRRLHGPQAELAREDADTFELLDLLYRQIGREVRRGPASDLLGQLQVPVVQAALNDRAFFLSPQHPARELLNAVAESGANWLGEDDTDPVLLAKLKAAVSKVLTEYTGDEAVFAQAHRDVQDHFQTAARKAEVAERRLVEAARGRDRLENAKTAAADSIDQALGARPIPPFVQALLSQAWADVLTLIRLRHGDDSDEWQEVSALTTRIADAVTGQDTPEPALPTQIEQALVKVGYHSDEAAVIARRLANAPEPELPGEPALKLQAKVAAAAQVAPRRPAPLPRSPTEQASYESLRRLPFGTWFEFVQNQQGDLRRLRLSWYNPTSGHALFVSARGQKVGEHTLDSVARLMAIDQARPVSEEHGSLLDRAWQAALAKLRDLAGMEAA